MSLPNVRNWYGWSDAYLVEKHETIFSYLPLNSGHISHTCNIPLPRNCPIETSMKKSGRPHVTKKNRNGIRNAPEM